MTELESLQIQKLFADNQKANTYTLLCRALEMFSLADARCREINKKIECIRSLNFN